MWGQEVYSSVILQRQYQWEVAVADEGVVLLHVIKIPFRCEWIKYVFPYRVSRASVRQQEMVNPQALRKALKECCVVKRKNLPGP